LNRFLKDRVRDALLQALTNGVRNEAHRGIPIRVVEILPPV
jgi:hypothetical protein